MADWQQKRPEALHCLQVPVAFDQWPDSERNALLAAAERLVADEEREVKRLVAKKPGAVNAPGFEQRRRLVLAFLAGIRREM